MSIRFKKNGCRSDLRVKLFEMRRPCSSHLIFFQDRLYYCNLVKTKQKVSESQDQVERLSQDLRNARNRKKRQKMTVRYLLEDLKEKNMLSEQLKQKLDFYSGWLIQVLLSSSSIHSSVVTCLCLD